MNTMTIATNNTIAMATTNTPSANDQTLVELFLQSKRSANTKEAYRRDLNIFNSYGVSIQASTLKTMLDFADDIAEGEMSVATQRRVLSTVKSLFSFAHKVGYVVFNVATAVNLPTIEDTLTEKLLTEKEVKQIIASATNTRDRAILMTLYVTGMRVSELCELEWRNLNAETQCVSFLSAKGKKTIVQRITSLSFWQAITEIRSNSTTPTAKVFTSRDENSITRQGVHAIVKQCAEKAMIEKPVSAHWLRHAKASHSLANGANVALVSRDLGHSSIAITSRYLHAMPSESSADFLNI